MGVRRYQAVNNQGSYFPAPWHESAATRNPKRQICAWNTCDETCYCELPVCLLHAVAIGDRVKDLVDFVRGETVEPTEYFRPDEYVYYLMLSPQKLKIGTTTNLPKRIGQLRTDVQYVVAIERGGMTLERQRHLEFAEERIGRREDFRISESLKSHIEALMPERDEIISEATTPPFGKMVPVMKRQPTRRIDSLIH